MTLKELLDSLTFDEIAPYILSMSEEWGETDVSLALYKLHFDYLRGLVPTNPESLGRKEARISFLYKGNNGKTYLDAFSLEGEIWADSLSKELVLDKKVKVCDAEIAACCLWSTSYYGFLSYQCKETFDDMFEDTEKQRELVNKYKDKFSKYIPSKQEIFAFPSFHKNVRREMKYYRRCRETKQGRRGDDGLSFEKRC